MEKVATKGKENTMKRATRQLEPTKDYYFTFGSEHAHPQGFVKLFGTFGSTRAEMVRRYGLKWSMQYETAEQAGVKRWELYDVDA
jgi:hypothetical protein